MFLVGFIFGVTLLTVLLLLFDREEQRADEEMMSTGIVNASISDNWEQTRNFLYYDGTEMPIKKEERYE